LEKTMTDILRSALIAARALETATHIETRIESRMDAIETLQCKLAAELVCLREELGLAAAQADRARANVTALEIVADARLAGSP